MNKRLPTVQDIKGILKGHKIETEADEITRLRAERDALTARVKELEWACSATQHDIQQTLGKALNYPWYKDDLKNFPNATEADGVCVGDHVAESLADETVTKITRLRAESERLRAYALKAFTVVEFCSGEGLLLPYPNYDCDDLLMEGVELLKVETSEEARAAITQETRDVEEVKKL